MTGTYPPSRLNLQAATGFLLTVEKHGADLQLSLQLQAANARVIAGLTDWTTDGEVALRRSVSPDAAEREILSLASFLRAQIPELAATEAGTED